MAVTIKTPPEIEKMRIAGRLAGEVLQMIRPHVRPGISTDELDRICNIPPRWMLWLQFGLGITGSLLAIAGGVMLLRGAFGGRLSHRMKPISLARAIIAGAWTIVYLVGRAMV